VTGAKITLFHAAPDFGGIYYSESPELAAHYTSKRFRDAVGKHSQKILDQAAGHAGAKSGIVVETSHAISEFPYDAIVRAAAKLKADVIVMASHGRRGVSGFLLGSETQKVLTHTKLPVLVVH